MSDYTAVFAGAGVVFSVWAMVGIVVNQVFWEPAIYLIIPILLWITVAVAFISVILPALWLYQQAIEYSSN